MKMTLSERLEFAMLNAQLVAKGILDGSMAMHDWEHYVRYLQLEAKKNGWWPELRWRDSWRPK